LAGQEEDKKYRTGFTSFIWARLAGKKQYKKLRAKTMPYSKSSLAFLM
jgi:hypothetical protein